MAGGSNCLTFDPSADAPPLMLANTFLRTFSSFNVLDIMARIWKVKDLMLIKQAKQSRSKCSTTKIREHRENGRKIRFLSQKLKTRTVKASFKIADKLLWEFFIYLTRK